MMVQLQAVNTQSRNEKKRFLVVLTLISWSSAGLWTERLSGRLLAQAACDHDPFASR
jgi:hypothetical protein